MDLSSSVSSFWICVCAASKENEQKRAEKYENDNTTVPKLPIVPPNWADVVLHAAPCVMSRMKHNWQSDRDYP